MYADKKTVKPSQPSPCTRGRGIHYPLRKEGVYDKVGQKHAEILVQAGLRKKTVLGSSEMSR